MDTSGLLVIAKTEIAMASWPNNFLIILSSERISHCVGVPEPGEEQSM